jgi:hypothetical protein
MIVAGQSLERGLCSQQLVTQLSLLLRRNVRRDGALHGHVSPLVALALDALEPFGQTFPVLGDLTVVGLDAGQQLLLQFGHYGVRQYLRLPLLSDGMLDGFEPEVRQLAAVAEGVTTGAEVVGVGVSGPTARDAVLQPATTAPTVDCAGQVVVVPGRSLARDAVTG